MVIIIFLDLDGLFVFSAPFPFFGEEPAPFGEVGIHDGVNGEDQILMLMIQQITEVFFDFVFQNQSGGDFTRSIAGRADFLGIDRNFRFHALPGDLHEAELWILAARHALPDPSS